VAAERSVGDERAEDSASVLAHLSHELRTPLNSMLALAQLLRDGLVGELNSEQQRYVEIIERSGQSLVRLVNDVLDLSRLKLGYPDVEIRSLDIRDQLEATVAALAPLAEAKGIALLVPCAAPLPLVRCDPERLRQILMNLMSNAIKFTDRGRVTLLAEAGERMVVVHVIDTGIGIPAPARARIFEEFFQVAPVGGHAGGRRGEGAGLGLAIARRLVRLMGGDLSVESTEGVGSRFTFTLPWAEGGVRLTKSHRSGVGDLAFGESEGEHDGARSAQRFHGERYGTTNTPGR
jgi:signal transduction histidine kinase